MDVSLDETAEAADATAALAVAGEAAAKEALRATPIRHGTSFTAIRVREQSQKELEHRIE